MGLSRIHARRAVLVSGLLTAGHVAYAQARQPDTVINGTFLGRGVECPQLLLETGERLSLSGGAVSGIEPGQKLRVTGRYARVSTCMEGRAFLVGKIDLLTVDGGN